MQKRLPVAAQVFQVWWYAPNEDKLSPDADLNVVRTAAPRYQAATARRSGGLDGRLRNIARTASFSSLPRPKLDGRRHWHQGTVFRLHRTVPAVEGGAATVRPALGSRDQHDGYRLMLRRDAHRVFTTAQNCSVTAVVSSVTFQPFVSAFSLAKFCSV